VACVRSGRRRSVVGVAQDRAWLHTVTTAVCASTACLHLLAFTRCCAGV